MFSSKNLITKIFFGQYGENYLSFLLFVSVGEFHLIKFVKPSSEVLILNSYRSAITGSLSREKMKQ